MGHDRFSRTAYQDFSSTTDKNDVASKGKERHRAGQGLDPLVDPKGYGLIRRSLRRMGEVGDYFQLNVGLPMLIESRLDTTGSMGNNVDLAFKALPKAYDLFSTALPRYDVQIITAIFGDAQDNYILCRSQAEMGIKIAEQMTLMVPEGGGGANGGEDPQYGMFGGAYLTSTDINLYGLKYYDFTITDEPSHDRIDRANLERVFGPTVFEVLAENGHGTITKNNLPSVKEVIDDLLKNAHAFVFVIGDRSDTVRYWPTVISKERIIMLPDTQFVSEVQAAIIGLTEGTLTLGTVEAFLINDTHLGKEDAKMIKRAVAGIPLGAQTLAPNFNKIPLQGAFFKNKKDIWPTTDEVVIPEEDNKKKTTWV